MRKTRRQLTAVVLGAALLVSSAVGGANVASLAADGEQSPEDSTQLVMLNETEAESSQAETDQAGEETETTEAELETESSQEETLQETETETTEADTDNPDTSDEAENLKQWKFDFNITGSATAEGWTGITVNGKGESGAQGYQYTPEQGYGIATEEEVAGRSEGVGNNDAYSYPEEMYTDFALLSGKEFWVDLPNGVYDVEVIVGSTNSNKTGVAIEGVDYGDFNPGKTEYGVKVIPGVEITDGQMNLAFDGDGRVNGIVITDVTPFEAKFDFNIPGSATAEGWTGITVNKKGGSSESDYYYTEEKGYGIVTEDRVEGRTESVGNNEEYSFPEEVYTDFALLGGKEFAVDLENGVYAVQFVIGSTNSNKTSVVIEDAYSGELNPGKSQYGVLSITGVVVSDGQMNMTFGGDGRVNGIVITTVSAPSNLEASVDVAGRSVGLTWSAANGAASYNVYRTDINSSITTQIANVTECAYTDNTVELLGQYTYFVKAVSSSGIESEATNEVSVEIRDSSVALPEAPSNLQVTEVTEDSTTLQWDAVDGALEYEVYWSDRNRTDLEGTDGFALISATTDTKYTYEISTHITRYFKVVAINAGGKSEASESVEAAAGKTITPQAEYLDRGLIAVATSGGVYVGWRITGDEYAKGASYELYRDGDLIATIGSGENSNYVDASGTMDSVYTVKAVIDGVTYQACDPVYVWGDQYLQVDLKKPEPYYDEHLTETYEYSPNDTNVADADGDGEYELFVKWDALSQDNSKSGFTAPVYIDCYKLDGTLLWRVNLGINIRAGAHYTQFQVFDFDGDGKAEMICKTADGTVDGAGNVIGDADADWRNGSGYILDGPEYLTLFDGETGEALDTIDYDPPRGNVNSWGDAYGNRVDRFLAGVAYLDGEHPSAIFARGYYTRAVVCAYDVVDDKLVQRWKIDSNDAGNEDLYGQGAHSLTTADVDNDGCQEVVYGSATIDHDGTLMYSLGAAGAGYGGHGDAQRVSDFNLKNPGQEIFMVHESHPWNAGIEMHDGATGEYVFAFPTNADTGRGASGDIDPRYEGAESWAIGMNDWDTREGKMITQDGEVIGNTIPAANFMIWWDGDLGREILDHEFVDNGTDYYPVSVHIAKWDWENEQQVNILEPEGLYSNNGTKGNPCFQADIFGDWREEAAWRTTDGNAIRIYTTVDPASYRLYTLMHDTQYRTQVACEATGYNQPPTTSFYIGFDTDLMNVPVPTLDIININDPVEPEDPTGPSETDPTDPTDPSETDPTEPTSPSETDPTEPTSPSETDPTDPTSPSETDPTDPTSPSESVDETNPDGGSADTGDTSMPIWILIAVMVVAVIGGGSVLIFRKKENRN